MGLLNRLRSWLRVKSLSFPFNVIPPAETGQDKLKEPYRQSVWVQRAIKKVAGPISAVSLRFSRPGSEEALEDSRLTEFWANPAVGLTYADFIEATVGWIKLKGESFWLLDDNTLTLPFPEVAGFPKLLVVNPSRMRHLVERGELVGWEYTDQDNRRFNLLPEQVVQCKTWNPYDPWRGLAEMEAAFIAAEADWLAGKFNQNLMKNTGDQEPYLVTEQTNISDVERKHIIEALREKRQLALRGVFKPMFLTGGLKVEQPKIELPGVELTDTRMSNRHEIFLAFGVPPSMADKMQSYSIGSASDWYMLIAETCVPTAAKIAGCIEQVVMKQINQQLSAWFDWDEHPVMQAVRRERIDVGLKLWGMGMPAREFNTYLQLALPEFEGWELGYLPFNVTPVGGEGFERDEDFAESDELERGPSLRAAGATSADKSRWRAQAVRRKQTINAYHRAISRVLHQARVETLRKLEGKGVTRAASHQVTFNLGDFKQELIRAASKQFKAALTQAGEQVMDELGLRDPFEAPPQEVLQALAERENLLSNAADEIYEAVRGEIEEGINEGEDIKEISDRVRSKFTEISKGRARRIAMTETAAVYGKGRQMAMAQTGVTHKKWLTSGNANVRDEHREANGQVVPVDQAFEVGGELLMYPGDPRGSAWNVINCHCVSVAVKGED